MKSADMEVIAMVNRPHEELARRREAEKKARRRQEAVQRALLMLWVRIELYLLGACLFCLGAMHQWVAGWLAASGVLICIAVAAVTLGRFLEVKRHG